MNTTQQIALDVGQKNLPTRVFAKQSDNKTRFLNITLLSNGEQIKPASTDKAVFRCVKPDGHCCINDATINSDGTIKVTLTAQVLACKGLTVADISIVNGDKIFSSAQFYIDCDPAATSGDTTASSDEFLFLVKQVNKGENLKSELSEINDIASANLLALQSENYKSQELLQGVEDIKAYIGYTDNDILGLCIDYENKKFTRLAGAAGKTAGADFDSLPMYGGMKRCNVSDDGTINAWYGDETFVNDETNGQVMVYVPKFYYKVVPLKLDKNTSGLGYHIRKANYYICDTPKAGFKLHPAFYDENGTEVDYFLYSAYEGSLYRASGNLYYDDNSSTTTNLNLETDKMCSISGKKPISGQNLAITRTVAEKYCTNRGTGWHCETIKALSALKLLMMIEFGTMNMQTAIGKGITLIPYSDSLGINYASVTGSTRNKGNATATASVTTNSGGGSDPENKTEDGMVAVSYRGIENPWGNIWRFITGVNVWGNGEMAGGQPYISDDFNYNELVHSGNYKPAGFTIANETGYIKAMGYGTEEYDWLFMPSEVGGTSALPVGDYWYRAENVSGHRIVRHGGAWNYGLYVGMFAGTSNSLYTASGNATGCRLIYLPTAE